MRKMLVVLVVIALILPFSSTALSAEGNRFGIGARIGFSSFDGDERQNATATNRYDWDFNTAGVYGISGTHFWGDRFSLELSIDFLKCDLDEKRIFPTPGSALELGEMKSIPLMLTGRVHHLFLNFFSPYIGVGIGYYLNDFDPNSSAFAAGETLDVDDSFGFHFNLGAEIFADEKNQLAFFFDGKYTWNETDFTFTSTTNAANNVVSDIDLNAIIGSIGVKYYF